MATGPEHYRQAERLIAGVMLEGTHPDGSLIVRSDEPQTIALAQAHATLALAAALGGLDYRGEAFGRSLAGAQAWDRLEEADK